LAEDNSYNRRRKTPKITTDKKQVEAKAVIRKDTINKKDNKG
jgi:hypothetical protein